MLVSKFGGSSLADAEQFREPVEFFQQFRDNVWVARAFRGIRPAVVALIAAPTFKMAQTAKINWTNVWIPVLGAFFIWMFGVSPVYVILAAGIGGYIYGRFMKPTE